MSREFIPVSVEYHIYTTSDWTKFMIVKGGWWSDREVDCLQGYDSLKDGIVFDHKIIEIKKAQFDRTLVEVRARCTLNIDRKYVDSNISYLITKGDIESTSVRIIVQGKEVERTTNSSNIAGNPRNPMAFNVSASLHVSTFLEQAGEDRISVEFLRLTSFVIDYLHYSTFVTLFLFLGLTLSVIGIVLYMTRLVTSLPLMIAMIYSGFFIFWAAFLYERRLKKRFTKYLDVLSQPTLMKSSEYESLVTAMEERLAHQIETLAETETKLKDLEKQREQITRQLKEFLEKRKKAGD